MDKITNKIKEFEGSCGTDMFLSGLTLVSTKATLGDAWEKVVTCPHCIFAKQCANLGELLETRGKNPRCGQIVDILLGNLSSDDESIGKLPYYPEANESFL